MIKNKSLRTKLSIILLLIYILSLLNVFFPLLRFASRTYNLLYANLFMCIPFILFAIGGISKHWYSVVLSTFIYGTLALLSVIIIVFNSYAISHMSAGEFDPSYKILSSYNYGGTQVNIYQITGGAISSFGIDVRQEKKLFNGLLIVRNLFTTYNKEVIIVEFNKDHLVIENRFYQLKENIYF